MSEKSVLMYKGHPLRRKDNLVYYGSMADKLLAINQLDQLVTKPLVEWLEGERIDFRLLVLSDHKTLLATRGHDGDPVPFFIYDSTKDQASGLSYTEANGLKGPYYPDGANTCMKLLFDL